MGRMESLPNLYNVTTINLLIKIKYVNEKTIKIWFLKYEYYMFYVSPFSDSLNTFDTRE